MSMTPADHNRAEMDRLFREHPTLYHMFKNNAEVYAWLKMASQGACTVEEALVGIIVRLAETNQKQFDEIVKIKYRQEYGDGSPQAHKR